MPSIWPVPTTKDSAKTTLWAAHIPIPYPMKFVTTLLDTATPITLIDPALDTPAARAALLALLGHFGLGWRDVERIIITHHHPDHYGLAGWIAQQSGASVLMLEEDVVRGEVYWHNWPAWVDAHIAHYQRHGLPDDADSVRQESQQTRSRIHVPQKIQLLRPQERLELAGLTWEVLWFPGHADGHLALWNAEAELLIAGDAILPRITPNIGLYAFSRPNPLADYLESLAKMQALAPVQAITGHYGPFLPDVAGRAAQISAHHHERLHDLTRLSQPMSAFAASFVLFPQELNPSGRRFALAETLAHLEYLRQQGSLRAETHDGVVFFGA
jgi:glyoxylase-like metal-dependent hydrolase (beta-lactamase superfamily II)